MCEKTYKDAEKLAEALYSTRKVVAKKFSDEVSKELESLSMPDAQLLINVSKRAKNQDGKFDLNVHGLDSVEFLFKPFPASNYLPMGSSASGGELSRLMLAMELVSAKQNRSNNQSMTFIFDEVDAGVGGVAAVELGKRLALLAKSAQVIVVTHLAQVAAFANVQFVVRKKIESAADSDDNSSFADTTVTKLDEISRQSEIARMLSGSQSQASLEHARELLKTSKI